MSYLKAAVEGTYGTSLDEFFVQGNHDQITQGTAGLTGTGAHDTADYGVFIIDEDDYQWYYSGFNQSKTEAVADALEEYLADKIEEGYSKPIFVASHVPLHYTLRTYKDGDGKYAKLIFDVLNEAGEA